jgi:hypothetical protein
VTNEARQEIKEKDQGEMFSLGKIKEQTHPVPASL